jgi:wyosine [tRNA(Phe)-imidazoG37] synthetase (radical SAM superfamily)
MQTQRQAFYEPVEISRAVEDRLAVARSASEQIDFLSFVPDGEPTLDINLGSEIGLLRPTSVPIAVISNGSLLWRDDVQEDLAMASWVSLKVDAVREDIWRQIDRPHGRLSLHAVLDGLQSFSKLFAGRLVTETMLVAGINEAEGHLRELGDFLASLGPEVIYLSVPTRPPAESWVEPAAEGAINQAYQILAERLDGLDCGPSLELLTGYEGNAFASTGRLAEDLLSITAVHPMREEAVDDLVRRTGADWQTVSCMVEHGQLAKVSYRGRAYYLRRPAA